MVEIALATSMQTLFRCMNIDPRVNSKFFKASTVHFALTKKVEAQLEKLEKQIIITPVSFSRWATPIALYLW